MLCVSVVWIIKNNPINFYTQTEIFKRSFKKIKRTGTVRESFDSRKKEVFLDNFTIFSARCSRVKSLSILLFLTASERVLNLLGFFFCSGVWSVTVGTVSSWKKTTMIFVTFKSLKGPPENKYRWWWQPRFDSLIFRKLPCVHSRSSFLFLRLFLVRSFVQLGPYKETTRSQPLQ